jgi:hypothetical protein
MFRVRTRMGGAAARRQSRTYRKDKQKDRPKAVSLNLMQLVL